MFDLPRRSMLLSFCAFFGDGFTGLGLMLAPTFILKIMLIHPLPEDPFLFRWIGAFACGVGLAYAIPLLEPAGPLRLAAMRNGFRVIAGIRILISLVVMGGIISGALVPAWISIPLYDGSFALLQLYLVKTELRDPAI